MMRAPVVAAAALLAPSPAAVNSPVADNALPAALRSCRDDFRNG
jgi:hypothetical protein